MVKDGAPFLRELRPAISFWKENKWPLGILKYFCMLLGVFPLVLDTLLLEQLPFSSDLDFGFVWFGVTCCWNFSVISTKESDAFSVGPVGLERNGWIFPSDLELSIILFSMINFIRSKVVSGFFSGDSWG